MKTYRVLLLGKLIIDNLGVEIKSPTRRAKIPFEMISGVERTLAKGLIIQTAGVSTYTVAFWNRKAEFESYDLIMNEINKKHPRPVIGA